MDISANFEIEFKNTARVLEITDVKYVQSEINVNKFFVEIYYDAEFIVEEFNKIIFKSLRSITYFNSVNKLADKYYQCLIKQCIEEDLRKQLCREVNALRIKELSFVDKEMFEDISVYENVYKY